MPECQNELRDLETAAKYYDIERLENYWNGRIDVNHSHENAELICIIGVPACTNVPG